MSRRSMLLVAAAVALAVALAWFYGDDSCSLDPIAGRRVTASCSK